MSQALEVDLKEIVLSNNSFGPNEIQQISLAIAEDYTQFQLLRDAVADLESREDRSPAAAVRLGVCLFLLGRYERAGQTLAQADGGAVAQFYLGKSHFALENSAKAIECYGAAKVAGYDQDSCSLAIAEALRFEGRIADAMETLDQMFGAVEQTAEYLYQRAATVASKGGNPTEVVALYERAVESDGDHPGSLFGLAIENDRRGNDDKALDLYQRAAKCFPSHVGALLNLGVMYEDQQRYDRAQMCYQRILDAFPDMLARGSSSKTPMLLAICSTTKRLRKSMIACHRC